MTPETLHAPAAAARPLPAEREAPCTGSCPDCSAARAVAQFDPKEARDV